MRDGTLLRLAITPPRMIRAIAAVSYGTKQSLLSVGCSKPLPPNSLPGEMTTHRSFAPRASRQRIQGDSVVPRTNGPNADIATHDGNAYCGSLRRPAIKWWSRPLGAMNMHGSGSPGNW